MSNNDSNKVLSSTQTFQKYFSVILADTTELKKQAYNIRYRVYCEEFNYESIDDYPNAMESDEYDPYALHCLIIHKSSRMPAACVRLVPAMNNSVNIKPAALKLLPFEKYCPDSIDHNCIKQLNLARNKQCEISRLAVEKTFRKRSGESLTRFGDINIELSKEEQRTFLLIAVAAFLAATALTELSGKTDVFAMMEPFLPRLLKRSGILFQRAGQDINYHGTRAPYFIKTESALDTMRPELLTLYQWIHQQLSPSYLKLN